ncbi:MAG: NAD-dependent epimerase/dehydratase family protein [Candidatus Omnitrophota bacterium]|nr:NAD-dependent epimerase/dehydratase family protein [Candidatus Omnitrophota bacterium]
MRKVIVTGAGGFIGHHLSKFLKAKGCYVVGVDIKKPEFEASKADKFIIYDIREKGKVWEDLFQGIDDVWALAADMGGMGFISQNHAAIMRNNVTININTLEAARKSKIKRYLYTSSACIYPVNLQTEEDSAPLAEHMAYPANPQHGYGWEKLYTEKLCEYYHEEFGLDIRIVRFHNTYGTMGAWRGGREKAPAAVCKKVAEAIKEGKDYVEIWGDGRQTRSFCYIDDTVKGLDILMESGYTKPLNIGSDEMVSINELADIIMKAAGVKLKKVYVDGPQGVRGRNSDNSLCKKILGWAPEIDLETGISKTYEWIKNQVEKSPIQNITNKT